MVIYHLFICTCISINRDSSALTVRVFYIKLSKVDIHKISVWHIFITLKLLSRTGGCLKLTAFFSLFIFLQKMKVDSVRELFLEPVRTGEKSYNFMLN